ncbi:MAG TPA: serine hydrolase [Vicinamibacterales bacterium]|nr:serine hydrolase [Vicinamibacterales bacterium]
MRPSLKTAGAASAACVLLIATVTGQQRAGYDYWGPQREMIQRGQQAIFMCNGLFTSNRTLEQVFAQELKFLQQPIGTAAGGDYEVDRAQRMVAVGKAGTAPVMRAVFREGIGCVIMAPDQTAADIAGLPSLDLPAPAGDAATMPWPDGDRVAETPLPPNIDAKGLQAASDWAFTRTSPEQVTVSLLVVHKGRIVHERYAPGFTMATRTRTWSTAKSIASALIGILVDRGKLQLDGPLGIEWLPRRTGTGTVADPRSAITLRHVLNMSSGLETVDNGGLEYATGSGMSYWAGASSVDGARNRGLIRQPGTSWDYENYDTLLAVYAMKQAIGDPAAYLKFPRQALLDRIGMRNTLISTDRFGDFILSSQVYTNARDLARLGLLYAQGGVWNGERIISEKWIAFTRTPAPATAQLGNQYGGHWWLVPDNRTDVPKDAFCTNGNRGQYTVVVPSHDLVIVRRGLDYGRQGFNQWDLTREVLKAFTSTRP